MIDIIFTVALKAIFQLDITDNYHQSTLKQHWQPFCSTP